MVKSFIATLIIVFSISIKVFACSCASTVAFCKSAEHLGNIAQINVSKVFDIEFGPGVFYEFEIEEVILSGHSFENDRLNLVMHGTSCDLFVNDLFEVGDQLIIAFDDPRAFEGADHPSITFWQCGTPFLRVESGIVLGDITNHSRNLDQWMSLRRFKNNINNLCSVAVFEDAELIITPNPGIDLNLQLYREAKYYYTGWQEPAVELQFLVNQEAFDKLPRDLQAILEVSIKLAGFESFINYQHGNIAEFKRLLEEHPDVNVRAFPRSIMRAFSQETRKKLQLIANSSDNDLTRRIINSQLKYQKDARNWTRFGDQAYLNNTAPIEPLEE